MNVFSYSDGLNLLQQCNSNSTHLAHQFISEKLKSVNKLSPNIDYTFISRINSINNYFISLLDVENINTLSKFTLIDLFAVYALRNETFVKSLFLLEKNTYLDALDNLPVKGICLTHQPQKPILTSFMSNIFKGHKAPISNIEFFHPGEFPKLLEYSKTHNKIGHAALGINNLTIDQLKKIIDGLLTKASANCTLLLNFNTENIDKTLKLKSYFINQVKIHSNIDDHTLLTKIR